MSRPRTPQPPSGGSSGNSGHPPTESDEGKQSAMEDAAEQVLDNLPTILKIAGNVAGNFGVPGLQTVFSALEEVVKKVQQASATINGIEELNKNIILLKGLFERFRGKSIPGSVQQNISNIFREWKKLEEEAEKLKSSNRFMRIVKSDKDARKLSELVQKYNRSLVNAQLESALNTEVIVTDIQDAVHKIGIRLDDSFMPMHARKAHYDAIITRGACLPGTRVDVLQIIWDWVDKNMSQLAKHSATHGKIFLVNGLAGMGKTTIAFSVADECDKKKTLAASYFCRRSDAECSDPNLIFITITRQLCRKYPTYKEKVNEILENDPDIVNAGVSRQLEKLIVEPLVALKGTLPASVVVIDALDECKDPNATSTILSALDKCIDRLAPLLFLITSRPEPPIMGRFVKSHLADMTTPLILHEIKPELAIEDIKVFLHHEIEEISRRLETGGKCASDRDIERLARLSNGLFIYARTALAFIEDPEVGNPERQLQSLFAMQSLAPAELDSLVVESGSQRAESIMDSLYSQILETSYLNVAGSLPNHLRTILGAIALTQEPLSATGLASLLNISEISLRSTLSGLRSVLHIPKDDSQPIQVIHATFPQFLLRESPSKPAAFHIRSAEGHIALLSRCFDVLNAGLRRDILDVKNPTIPKHEIPDLSDKVGRRIPSHLRYACKYWAAHLQGSVGDSGLINLFNKIQEFLHNKLLYWLEACCWLDAFAIAVKNLSIACRCFSRHEELSVSIFSSLFHVIKGFVQDGLSGWLGVYGLLTVCNVAVNGLGAACHWFTSPECLSTFIPLLTDCQRFALAYSSCIQDTPLQVYYSVLSLAPRCNLVAETYAKEVQHPLIIRQGARMDWGPYLAIKQQDMYSVVFAPNGGARFVTGGADKTVYVWDSTTYTKILSMDGHTSCVMSVRYSPDGKYIVSGSRDTTVRLWDAESGAHIRTLEGHRDSVCSLTYSAGNRVLAATHIGIVKLWDASDGQCMLTFATGAFMTEQVSISPNGSLITYCTTSSLCLLDVSTEERVYLDLPKHAATSREHAAAFSPDGRYVAGWTNGVPEIYVWSVSDRVLRRIVDLHTSLGRVIEADGWAAYLVFSSDSTQIGCGCRDGSVRLWQVATDDPPLVLTGHHGYIYDIAWSPDGSQLISADNDTVRVWDLSHRATTGDVAWPRPHRHPPDAVPRFAVITSGNAVTLCDLLHMAVAGKSCGDVISLPEGAPLVTLYSTIGEAWSLAMASKDDDDRALRTRCGFAHIWEFCTGRRMFQRRGSSMPPVLSQDGSLLAYTPPNANQSVHICNVTSGMDILTFAHGHTSHITAVSFSADGKRLATGSADNNVKVWDVASGRLIASHSRHTEPVEAVALSSDGRLVVSGQHGHGGARVLDTHTGRVSGWHKYLSYAVDFIFTSDDRAIVAFTESGLLVWDVATETNTHTYSNFPHPTWLDSVSFSPDDTGVLLDEGGDTIQLWRPGERTWPVYTIDPDGWVYATRPGRTQRLCWLPLEWRNPLSSDGDTFCVFDYNERKVIELDMSQLLLGAETWSQ